MPKGDIFVKNVFEAIATYPNGDTRFIGCLTSSAIEKTVNTEDIRCGIYGDLKAILALDQDMSITLNTANWNDYILEMTSGGLFDLGESVTVKTYELVSFVAATLDATAPIIGTPVGGTVQVQDLQGTMYDATFGTGTVTVTGGAATLAGTKAYVLYTKTITADVLDLRSDTLPEVFDLTLHAIALPVGGGSPVADLYFNFPTVQPQGDMSIAGATNTNATNEVVLRVLPVGGSFGTYMVEASA